MQYLLIILGFGTLFFGIYHWFQYKRNKVQAGLEHTKRVALWYLLGGLTAIIGIQATLQDLVMKFWGIQEELNYQIYSLVVYFIFAATTVLIVKTSGGKLWLKQIHKGTGDNIANDKVSGDKVEGPQTKVETVQGDLIQGNQTKVEGDYVTGDQTKIIQQAPTKIPKELTTYLPRRSADEITGRDSKLGDLRQLLQDGKKVVVLNGMGGIGKTTLAEAYTGEYYETYQHIVWITQENEDIAVDFASAPGIKTNLQVPSTLSDPQDIFQEILRKCKGLEDSPNLLVLDNAIPSIEKYTDFLPKPPHWHLLLTSRDKIEDFSVLELDHLKPEDALRLFKKHCTLFPNEEQIKQLLKDIEYHTLTIEILAKTAQYRGLSFKQVQEALSTDTKSGVKTRHSKEKGKIEQVMSYLESIFDLQTLSEGEKWLLKQFACLPTKYESVGWLREVIMPQQSAHEEDFVAILNTLADKGLLQRNPQTSGFKVHALISDIAWNKLNPAEQDLLPLIQSITGKLNIDQTKDNPIDKFIWEPLGRTVENRFPSSEKPEISQLQNNFALVLQDLGDYEGAKKMLEKAKNSTEKNFGKDHPKTAISYSNLATVLQNLGDYEGAKKLLEKVKNSTENNFGKDHPKTAASYSNLATALQDLGDYEEAKKLLEKAKKSDEKNFGKDHPTTAVRYSNLATVLQNLGEYEEAKKLLEKAKKSNEKNFGKDHPTTAVSYSNLATVLQDLGEYEEAKTLLEKAKKSTEKNFGKDHPETARSYSNLATVLKDLGEYEGAKKLLEKAKNSTEKNFGKDHPTTALSYSNLALVLKELGDYEGAKTLLEKAKNSSEKNFGKDHPATARNYSCLALVLQRLGDYEGAKTLLEKAKKSDEKNFGKEHPTTAASYSNLALVLKDLGDYEGAKRLLEKAKNSAEKNFGAEHPTTAIRYSNLATVLQAIGDYEGAKTLLEKAKKSTEKNFGKEHPTTAVSYSNLATVLLYLGDYEEALNLSENALIIFRHVLPKGHPNIKVVEGNIKEIRKAMNQ